MIRKFVAMCSDLKRIFHVNDSPNLHEIFREEFPEFTIQEFTNFHEAIQSEGKCELLVIDLTTVASPFDGIRGTMCNLFAAWVKKRPHCPIVIWTAMPPDWTQELIEELQNCDVDVPKIKHVTLSMGCLKDNRNVFLKMCHYE